MTRVTSPQNPRLKEVARLVASSRDRRKAGRCVLEGEHLVEVYVAQRGAPEVLLVREDALRAPGDRRAGPRACRRPGCSSCRAAVFDVVGSPPEGVGVLAVVATPPPAPRADDARFLLLLDDLQDPGNLGSILRTAAAFGVERVELSRALRVRVVAEGAARRAGCALPAGDPRGCGPGRARARAAGARRARAGVGRRRVGEDIRAVAAGGGRVALAIGNEGAGVSPALRAAADLEVTMPMRGRMESLNAAAAAAVLLHELARATPA